jgi:hypothetical protein
MPLELSPFSATSGVGQNLTNDLAIFATVTKCQTTQRSLENHLDCSSRYPEIFPLLVNILIHGELPDLLTKHTRLFLTQTLPKSIFHITYQRPVQSVSETNTMNFFAIVIHLAIWGIKHDISKLLETLLSILTRSRDLYTYIVVNQEKTAGYWIYISNLFFDTAGLEVFTNRVTQTSLCPLLSYIQLLFSRCSFLSRSKSRLCTKLRRAHK